MLLPSLSTNGATTTGTTCLLLIDPHTAFRQALAILLTQGSSTTVIRHACTLEEGCRALVGVDCVAVALDLADQPSMVFLHEVRVRHPHCPILMLTHSAGETTMLPVQEALGIEVLPVSASGEEVLRAIRCLGLISRTA
jgi:DNA-binding NarL/FixJ family response regulator